MTEEKKKKQTFKDFIRQSKLRGEKGYLAGDSLLSNILINPVSLPLTFLIKRLNIRITPNQLTYSRLIFFTPLMILTLFLAPILNNPLYYLYSAILFYIIILTDFMDGQVARSMNMKSSVGDFLDSVSDKLGTPLFFILCFSAGLLLTNAFLLFGSIVAFILRSTSADLTNMIFLRKERDGVKKEIRHSFSAMKDKKNLGIEQTLSFVNKIINSLIKETRGIVNFERQFITIILPCLLLAFRITLVAKYLLLFFLVFYSLFFLLRVRSILKQAHKFFQVA